MTDSSSKQVKASKVSRVVREEKVSFTVISRNYVAAILHSPEASLIFKDHFFHRKFSVLLSDDGQRIVIEEKERGLIVHTCADAIIDAIIQFSDLLDDLNFKMYKIDHDKAKKIYKYWQAICPIFEHEIRPVLQKSTRGYCYHRLDFDMAAMETPTFDYLLGALEDNEDAFLAFLGALFDPTKTLQQYLWLAGSGGDGKGSLFRLLARIFNQSYCSVATDNKAIDKYWQSLLVGKRLAVSGDTRNLNFINCTEFMQASGGDHVTVRPMYKQAYTAKLTAMFILAANGDPMVTSEDSGQRRAIVCRFKKREGDEAKFIPDFEGKLWEERAGIVKKCWAKWQEVKELLRIPVCAESLTRLGEDTEESHQALLDKYFQIIPGSWVTASDMNNKIDEERRNLTQIEKSSWIRYLQRVHGVTRKPKKIPKTGKTVKIYEGMCLKGVQVSEDTEF